MKHLKLAGIILLIAIFTSCKKGTNTNIIKIDVPFEASINQKYYLYDTVTNVGATNYNAIQFVISSIKDDRQTGIGCSSSTGGLAYIYSKINLNSGLSYIDTLIMPGCTNGGEWDTTNVNAPRFVFNNYKLFLLKLDPYNNVLSNMNDYQVKYVFTH